jgi:primosomal protein N' (replication factor Y)
MSAVNRKQQAPLFAADMIGPFAGIVLNRPVETILTYHVPENLRESLQVGARVHIPLGRGNKPAIGYCVQINETQPEGVDPERVKDLLDVLDDPPLIDATMLELTRWMAGYYACSWGQALDAVVPAGVKKAAGTQIRTCLVRTEESTEALKQGSVPVKQAEILALLERAAEPLTVADVCRLVRCTTGPIAALRKRGLIRAVKRRMDRAIAPKVEDAEAPRAALELTEEQRHVLDTINPAVESDAFGVFLLHGVTGSGKTEVYLSAIDRVVARGREAIVLVPEISLTPQTIRRFKRRFPKVAVLHSHLSDAERHRHWRAIARGEIQVVVGARSAVFAPTRNLGLIVIDEEHESTFKQESVPRYHARDIAVKRAQLEKVPVILGSATPAMETWQNCELGRFTRLTLSRRVLDRPMPAVEIIDLKHEKPSVGNPIGGLSGALKTAMREALEKGGQVILLLNRRGFHTFILCPKCGQVLKCDSCDNALTHHKDRRRVICHLCDTDREPPTYCPSCNGQLYYGGIGTERLEREVRENFPNHPARRMDSDTMRSPGSHENVLKAFKEGEFPILLGTQMIAKGLDFPNVTLVGVVSADTALHLPDFRAAERTFQLVAQVAGRTGRGDKPGRVLVQTYSPDAAAILFAARHDYLGFVRDELHNRRSQPYPVPPFGRIVRLVARGPDEGTVERFLQHVADSFTSRAPSNIRLRGPIAAPVSKIKNLFRFQLQLHASTAKPLQILLQQVIPHLLPPPGVELAVDVDPVSML